jgi:hypothetical protein
LPDPHHRPAHFYPTIESAVAPTAETGADWTAASAARQASPSGDKAIPGRRGLMACRDPELAHGPSDPASTAFGVSNVARLTRWQAGW